MMKHMARSGEVGGISKVKVNICFTCCDACHSEHPTMAHAIVHWHWLRIKAIAQKLCRYHNVSQK